MMTTCSTGTENALKLALETNAKLVYTSSCEVYGDPMVSPQTEDYTGNVSTIGPRSAYEEAKRMGETWVRLYQENYAVNAKVVRIFNTYGEGMHIEDTRVIPSFIRNIKQGKPVVIYGNGEQQRTHMHVDDLVNGLQTVLHEGQAGEAYNIGGVNPISIKQLADIFRELVDDNIEIHYKQHFIEDHMSRKPCVKKVSTLGWNSHVSLKSGLARMLNTYGVPVKDDYMYLVTPQEVRTPSVLQG